MKTYKNKNFVKRDYEATNVVFAVAPDNNSRLIDGDIWTETTDAVPASMTPLFIVAGVRYFGWL